MLTKYSYSTIDNGYIRLLYGYGVVGVIVFVLFYYLTVKKLIDKNKYVYLVAIIIFSIWAISENVLYSFYFNFTLLFWNEILGNKKSK